jgi:hypothetical protein
MTPQTSPSVGGLDVVLVVGVLVVGVLVVGMTAVSPEQAAVARAIAPRARMRRNCINLIIPPRAAAQPGSLTARYALPGFWAH